MHRGPLIPTLSLATGIALSHLTGAPWLCGIIAIALGIALYLCVLKNARNPVSAFRMGKWHIVWVILLFLGIGSTDESLARPYSLEKSFGIIPEKLYCEVTGVLTKTYGERVDVIIEQTNGAKARIWTGGMNVKEGDIILIPSYCLKSIENDTTDFGKKILPMMRAAGIKYSGRIVPKNIEVVGRSRNPKYFFKSIREKIEICVERSHLERSTANFLNAILMGDKTGLDEHTRLTFANGGLAHMLALSGLHIGILAGFLLILMWPIKFAGHYKWGYIVAILMLWIYVVVTGMAYSSVRAAIMTTFAFMGIIAERKNFAGNALCSACLLILIVDPHALFDVGFQLSVVCVGALIAFASRLNPIGHRNHPKLYVVCGAVITTIVATTASWALTSYYFSQIPLMFLPTNVILLPILPLYLSLSVVYVFLLFMGIEMGLLATILEHGYQFLLKSAEWLSNGTEFVVDYQLPIWGVLLWLSLLGVGAFLINRKDL